MQVRVAEALCLLPVFGTEYILGVVLGCFLSNLLGSTIVDVIFGTLATLLAPHFGLVGVWMAMSFELTMRGVLFLVRLAHGRWLDKGALA